MKKLLFVLLAGTFVMASCGKKSPAQVAADKMCNCAGAKTMAAAQKEKEAAGTDSTKLAAATGKLMEASKGLMACITELEPLMKDIKAEDQEKVKKEMEAAMEKQCPDIAKMGK